MKRFLNYTKEQIAELPYSRQYKRQIELYQNGKCILCFKPNPEKKTICPTCADKRRKGKPRRSPVDWAAVDWSKPVQSIAESHNVHEQTIYAAARRLKIKVRASSKHRWDQVDWNKDPKEIAWDLGVTATAVYLKRKRALAGGRAAN